MTASQSRAAAGARRPSRSRKGARDFLVVTGMSGAGKSHAIRALEDLGYYCVDNLPTPLIPVLADLAARARTPTTRRSPSWSTFASAGSFASFRRCGAA